MNCSTSKDKIWDNCDSQAKLNSHSFLYFFSKSLFPLELFIPLILMKVGSWLERQISSSLLTDGMANGPY